MSPKITDSRVFQVVVFISTLVCAAIYAWSIHNWKFTRPNHSSVILLFTAGVGAISGLAYFAFPCDDPSSERNATPKPEETPAPVRRQFQSAEEIKKTVSEMVVIANQQEIDRRKAKEAEEFSLRNKCKEEFAQRIHRDFSPDIPVIDDPDFGCYATLFEDSWHSYRIRSQSYLNFSGYEIIRKFHPTIPFQYTAELVDWDRHIDFPLGEDPISILATIARLSAEWSRIHKVPPPQEVNPCE